VTETDERNLSPVRNVTTDLSPSLSLSLSLSLARSLSHGGTLNRRDTADADNISGSEIGFSERLTVKAQLSVCHGELKSSGSGMREGGGGEGGCFVIR